jgi:hypothetical protein
MLLAETIARYAADNNLKRQTMSTDSVIECDNARLPKIFSNELLHRDIEASLAMVFMASLPSRVTKPCGLLQRATWSC